jgi:hypothetical protein
LCFQSIDQLVQEPARHALALARIRPAKIEKMRQKHLPVQLHVGEQTPPIDLLMLPEDEVGDIRTVIAMPKLNEGLGPDQLRRRDHAHRRAKHLDAWRAFEPLIGHGNHAVPRGEDHVKKVFALEDLAEPTLVLDLDGVTETSEVAEDTRIIARLAEDIEVLGRARDPGIGAERIGAGQQERKTELCEFAQRLGVERLGAL